MKPICLTMVAFGSFPEKEVIHFDTLGEAPLFLINGPTGSGKTTILDAICFALYGETTGEEREARQMRCDFADAQALTEVELMFELAGQRYRIRRVPEQQRPKARGEGTTTQSPEAQLWRLDDAGEEHVVVSSKVREATEEVETLTGLTVNQFRQVMVLPQGKFRQLLLAESKDREHIFGQLFQTHIYKKLEDKLKLKANAISLEVKNKQQLQQGVLEGAGLESTEDLDVALENDKIALASILAKKQILQKEVNAADERYQKDKALEDSFLRLDKTRMVVDQLLQQKDAFVQVKQQIKLSESAEQIKPVRLELQRYQDEVARADSAQREVNDCLAEAIKQQQEAEVAKKQAIEDRGVLDEKKKKLSYLHSLEQRMKAYSQAQHEEKAAKGELALAKKTREKSESNWKTSEESQKLIHAEISELQRRVNAGEKLPLQQVSEHKQVEVRQQIDSLLVSITTKEEQLSALEKEGGRLSAISQEAIAGTQRLTLIWHQGQAAVLAKALNQGEPCMVCGSEDHPAPANNSAINIPTDEELEQSRQHEQRCHQSLMAARESYAQLAAEIKGLKKQSDALTETLTDANGAYSNRSLTDMQAELKRVTEALSQWNSDREMLQRTQKRLDGLRSREDQLLVALEKARAAETQCQSTYATVNAVLQQAGQELPEEYRAENVLLSRIQQMATAVEQGEAKQQQIQQQWESTVAKVHALTSQQMERKQALENALSQSHAAQQRWIQALENSPFDSEVAYHAHQQSTDELQKLRHSLQEFEQKSAGQEGALKEQREFLSDKQRPDLLVIEQELQVAKQALEEANAQWLVLDKRVDLWNSTQKTLLEMKQQAKKLEASYALYGTLSNVANGQSYEKISLQRFVLGVLLDDVLIEASRRLSLMSKGRYLLLRKTEKAKGNKASGLELMVDDAYTGVQRPVATLSGGESFMAALSLALGLSDVVQAYSGGVRLDMLFIDEGFGSLDPESLELAIRTLLDLQAAGRMVGVISHVSDLREQIPLRLDVISGHRGSHTELVGAVV